MKFPVVAALVLSASVCLAQTPINAGRALRPLEKQGVVAPRPGMAPSTLPPKTTATTTAVAPVYVQPVAKKVPTPSAKVSKKLGVSAIEIKAGKEKEDGITGTLYVTNLTDEALAPFAQFTVLSTNTADVGVEFGRIHKLGPKEVAKMEVNTTKTGAASLRLVKMSSKLGED